MILEPVCASSPPAGLFKNTHALDPAPKSWIGDKPLYFLNIPQAILMHSQS